MGTSKNKHTLVVARDCTTYDAICTALASGRAPLQCLVLAMRKEREWLSCALPFFGGRMSALSPDGQKLQAFAPVDLRASGGTAAVADIDMLVFHDGVVATSLLNLGGDTGKRQLARGSEGGSEDGSEDDQLRGVVASEDAVLCGATDTLSRLAEALADHLASTPDAAVGNAPKQQAMQQAMQVMLVDRTRQEVPLPIGELLAPSGSATSVSLKGQSLTSYSCALVGFVLRHAKGLTELDMSDINGQRHGPIGKAHKWLGTLQPSLELPPGHRFLLFLSHTWATGKRVSEECE